MEAPSIFIAQLLGIIYLVAGAGILINPDRYKNVMKDFLTNPSHVYLGGMMALATGLLIVRFHNVWESSWVVLITIIGWIAVLKGVILVVAPKGLEQMSAVWMDRMRVAGIIALVFGVVLAYFGFYA